MRSGIAALIAGLASAGILAPITPAAKAAGPAVQVEVCNDGSATRTMRLDGLNQDGGRAVTSDFTLRSSECNVVRNWWWLIGNDVFIRFSNPNNLTLCAVPRSARDGSTFRCNVR